MVRYYMQYNDLVKLTNIFRYLAYEHYNTNVLKSIKDKKKKQYHNCYSTKKLYNEICQNNTYFYWFIQFFFSIET